MNNYRLYVFTNMYLSSIQKGIQTAHVVAELMNLHHDNRMVINWATRDKTIIVLNGGDQSSLKRIYNILATKEHFPWEHFRESRESLNGALTAVGVILPEEIWNKDKNVRYPKGFEYFEEFLENAQLAI